MIKNSLKFAATALSLFSAGYTFAGTASAPYNNSSIDARLNVSIKPDTETVRFIRDNADPNVITKTYVLKHADPYELKSYIRKMVQTRRVNSCNTNVKAIQYTDGTSVLLISAEDYRFNDSKNSQGFDTIIRELDKPGITSSSGRLTYVYAPKFRSAESLQSMVDKIGANTNNVVMNNIGGTDALAYDRELNLMFFKTAPFSKQNIFNVLAEYDRPAPEVRAHVTLYEIYAENDTKLGLDFQAWKNNDGIDLFHAGGRFMNNYAPNGTALVNGANWGSTKYFNFNPKWNTKYIDFLTTRGKAKVLHSSEIKLTNGAAGTISRTTSMFLPVTNEEKVVNDAVSMQAWEFTGLPVGTVVASKLNGKNISILTAAPGAKLTVTEQITDGISSYTVKIHNGSLAVNGVPSGNRENAVQLLLDTADAVKVNNLYPVQRAKTIDTLPSSKEFGFTMTLTPEISATATILHVNINNSSLIGYTADGQPRIQKEAAVNTSFMIDNAGTKLVIGGINKSDVVRVSGGLPVLKDLPLIGWIFSTESESTKKSLLLAVVEVVPVAAGEGFSAGEKAVMDKINGNLKNAGESNSYGYRQFLIDKER